MTSTPKPAPGATARQDDADEATPREAVGPFVLNLTSSTTPMALSNPEQPELKRFSFFVSRRFEEGRERFRLHMGYFATLAEAEEWLSAVRDIYPGAWAGEAPGKKLRERAVAAAAAQAQHAAGPPPPAVPATHQSPVATAPRNVPAGPAAQTPPAGAPVLNVPTVHAATPPARAAAPAAAAKPSFTAGRPPLATPATAPSVIGMMRTPKAVAAPKAAPVAPAAAPRSTAPLQARSGVPLHAVTAVPTAAPTPAAAAPARAATGARHGAPAAAGSRAAQPARTAVPASQHKSVAQTPAARAQGAAPAPQRPDQKGGSKALFANSNVREVLKALDEPSGAGELTGETRVMPASTPAAPGRSRDDTEFTDTQVLKFLETRRSDGTELSGVDVESGAISLLKPDDTGTRQALKEAVTDNAPVSFAVQLQWSVEPVELSKVPPLAIFSAYTLYTVEGSRDGRRWFGLRLGFFSDAISAKQVAYYVRSEFTSVAVVPVSPRERTHASEADKKSEIAFPKKSRSGPVDEFKLIDSDDAQPASAQPRQVVANPAASSRTAPPVGAAGRRKGNNRVRAREARAPQTLEETLEILGAGELEMDNSKGEGLNDSGVRHLRVEVQKNTPFSRLLERLSERVRKP